MANENSTALTFTTCANIYEFAPDASKSDIRDQLNAKIAQSQALLNMLVSDGGLEHFKSMGAQWQADYLWSISMSVDEAKDLIGRL